MKDPQPLVARDVEAFTRFLTEAYGFITPVALSFLPVGEDGWHCRLEIESSEDKETIFITIRSKPDDPKQLEALWDISRSMPCVVAPLRTRSGGLCVGWPSPFFPLSVTAFPFIEGSTREPPSLNPTRLKLIGRRLAELHALQPPLELESKLPSLEFEGSLRNAIDIAEARTWQNTEEAQWLGCALLANLPNVLGLLEHLKDGEMRIASDTAMSSLTVIHGDPNWANIIWLHEDMKIVDWTDLALGRVEQDLFAFADVKNFAVLLTEYLEVSRRRDLDWRLLDFFNRRWVLQEITDYCVSLFSVTASAAQRRHWQQEIAPYINNRPSDLDTNGEQLKSVVEGCLEAVFGDAACV